MHKVHKKMFWRLLCVDNVDVIDCQICDNVKLWSSVHKKALQWPSVRLWYLRRISTNPLEMLQLTLSRPFAIWILKFSLKLAKQKNEKASVAKIALCTRSCLCTRQRYLWCVGINTLRPRWNGRHFPHNIFKCIFVSENVWILIEISLKFDPKGPIINIPALV